MNPEHWQKVRRICEDALECEAAGREDFLLKACAGDEVLLKEVESYLAFGSSDDGLLKGPAIAIAAKAMAKDDARRGEPDLSGQTLAHYRISGKIGQGGMGAVYRALDTKLGREVAIKVLPAPFADDPDRMSRFAREAKVLASLNHPHIAQIYGVEDRALVMELVPGGPLPLPLPIETALHYAKQIAEALESAHEKGIVHRDLKPANIMVTPEGQVKLLDFGLAAIARVSPAGEQLSLTTATELGLILGTAAYMSPEQAAGKPVDKRSDIWSFGVVLWEMLTGHRLFQGESITHTLSEVLNGPIDFEKLPRETPASIRGLLRRCLERNPKNRLRDIGEARIAIEAALSGEPQSAEPAATLGKGRRPWLAWGVSLALAVSLGAFTFLHLREKPPAAMGPVRFQFPRPENGMNCPVLSPDGRRLAFLSDDDRLWVHSLESGESHEITPTDGGVAFWSPDSRNIGYLYQGKIRRIEANGGMPQTVTALSVPDAWGGGAWNQEDTIIFAERSKGFYRVPASGGAPIQITALDASRHENSQYMPSFLPDGRHFVYLRSFTDEGKTAVYVASVNAKPEQQSNRPLVAANSQPAYAPTADPDTGSLLFISGTTLMAQPFDNRRLDLKGQALPVAEQVRRSIPGASYVQFSVSGNGVIIFPQINQQAQQGRQFTWYDRDGKVHGTLGERVAAIQGAQSWEGLGELSPDRTRLALTRGGWGADAGNIWLMDLSRGGALTRFTFGALIDLNPVWSPDGSRIVFSSNRDGQFNLYEKPANGASEERVLLQSDVPKQSTSWSRDGRTLLYTVADAKRKRDIWALPLDGGMKPVPFAATEFDEHMGRFSPDGRWVAYVSDESGQEEIYVRSFAMNAARTSVEAGGKWPVSYEWGLYPLWRVDGREIYYQSRDGKIKAVEITTAPAFRAGTPRELAVPGQDAWTTADGRRFLVGVFGKSAPRPFVVELNWPAALKQ